MRVVFRYVYSVYNAYIKIYAGILLFLYMHYTRRHSLKIFLKIEEANSIKKTDSIRVILEVHLNNFNIIIYKNFDKH